MPGKRASRNSSESLGGQAQVNVVVLSMDARLVAAAADAQTQLRHDLPGLNIRVHVAADFESDPATLTAAVRDVESADVIIAGMMFLDQQIAPILPALKARAPKCQAIVGCLSAPEIVKLTRLGAFRMDKPDSALTRALKKLRGGGKPAASGGAGKQQANMLRQLPKILKFIPGPAQDLRAYFLTMQYWLGGTDENFRNLVAYLLDRYVDGASGRIEVAPPIEAPDVGVYHPTFEGRASENAAKLPFARTKRPTVGLLLLRSYVLSNDTDHYDGVIEALEAQGLRVIPAFAGGLDARPAIEKYFVRDGQPIVDAIVSLTGFSLVGGPAYNDSGSAAKVLAGLDVPYLAAHALEFQTLDAWGGGDAGLSPVEATMMVAIPELDGATNPIVFGGRAADGATCNGCARACVFGKSAGGRRLRRCPERAEMLAARTMKLIRLRMTPVDERKVAIVLFNFPPNSGAAGTAAYLSVYRSLFNTMKALKAAGHDVDLPSDAEELKERILGGNAERYGADANVVDRIPVNSYVAQERRLAEIEANWGPAPGRLQADGASIHVLGASFGNVFVGLQPSFGVEGDPMKLLFEGGFSPTHAFAAFYRYLREDFGADAILHFGTHGALEFMPGKQTGVGAQCWSDYLIDATPNIYFYAANNPSEAAIAKRRSAATTVSYLTPAVTKAGLYKGLADLKDSIDRARQPDAKHDAALVELIQAQAAELKLADASPTWPANVVSAEIERLSKDLTELEHALIPDGLHVAGEGMSLGARKDLLSVIAEIDAADLKSNEAQTGSLIPAEAIADIAEGADASAVAARYKIVDRHERLERLATIALRLAEDAELPALMRALRGGFTPPAPGGDVIRNAETLPTGRNIHGFDPFRMPSAFALADGARQANRIIDRAVAETGKTPETMAIVLWGADNLKSEGAQIAQALALIGARARFDAYGRLAGAELIPLDQLGRARIDVVLTLSGIFRDLLPMQTRLLADAAMQAAAADEPLDVNPIRRHALAYQAETGADLATAALRVFSNAHGAYGSNVNQLIDAGCWEEGSELADAYANRKCFAYGATGGPAAQPDLLNAILKDVDVAYQNLESVELGVTTIDHYFDTLGGISKAVARAKGSEAPVLIGDQTRGDGLVRTLGEQLRIETRTRTLNPKWYEGMLAHGYEGVRQIEAQVTNTLGWSATTSTVDPWIYQEISETFVLDEKLRDRLAELNPKACMRVANRLLEACDRDLWKPSPDTLEALRRAGEDLEDRLEGVYAQGGAAA
ncbi:MAG: magnesium chelatase subunit H [Alphaproteobacteria bacterium]|nr:magnesium chelatase subunit H [Alphaproteobacteria bacterium]